MQGIGYVHGDDIIFITTISCAKLEPCTVWVRVMNHLAEVAIGLESGNSKAQAYFEILHIALNYFD